MRQATPILGSAHSVTHTLIFRWPGFGHAPLGAAQGEAGTLAFENVIHVNRTSTHERGNLNDFRAMLTIISVIVALCKGAMYVRGRKKSVGPESRDGCRAHLQSLPAWDPSSGYSS